MEFENSVAKPFKKCNIYRTDPGKSRNKEQQTGKEKQYSEIGGWMENLIPKLLQYLQP